MSATGTPRAPHSRATPLSDAATPRSTSRCLVKEGFFWRPQGYRSLSETYGEWSQQARLDPIDQVPEGLYGLCVSLDQNTAVIGAERPNEAEVFVNNNGTWSLQQLITGPDDSDFGTSVKVIGDMLMVTAYDAFNPHGIFSGVAYIFTRG